MQCPIYGNVIRNRSQIYFSILSSIGSVCFSIANLKKSDRNKTDEVYTLNFVPSSKLPNKTAHKYDPFLEPMIREIEELFINGRLILSL